MTSPMPFTRAACWFKARSQEPQRLLGLTACLLPPSFSTRTSSIHNREPRVAPGE